MRLVRRTVRLGMLSAAALFVLGAPLAADDEASRRAIEARLEAWTEDFNARRIDQVCDLFAPDLRSNYRGHPENTYETQCAGLNEALSRDDQTYAYALDLQEIMVSGDMAAVRLVWHLTVTDTATGEEFHSSDRGLDVFQLQPDGQWRIARFIAYEIEDE